MVARLDQVKVRLVGVVVVGDVGVGNVDLRVDFFIEELLFGAAPADLFLQVVERQVLAFESLLKLLLGVRGLHLGQLGLYLIVGRRKVELGRALVHDLLIDLLANDIQTNVVSLVFGRLLFGFSQIRLVQPLHVGPHDRLAVDHGNHIWTMFLRTARYSCGDGHQAQQGGDAYIALRKTLRP